MNTHLYRIIRFAACLSLVALIVVPATMGTVPVAHAASLTVTTPNDNTTTDGQCSLREALTNANNNAQTYIDCAAGNGVDTITFSINGTITLVSPLPAITDPLTIDGTGHSITVDGHGQYRVFYLDWTKLTLQNLAVYNGMVNGDNGAGIYNNLGVLSLANVTLSGNQAVPTGADTGNGGAIFNQGSLTVVNSTFSGNAAGGAGGALYNFLAPFHFTNVTLSNNSASSGNGGGVYNYGLFISSVKNTILANNTGGNCAGDAWNESIGNLRWPTSDTSCAPTIAFGDPRLAALAANGSTTTQTMALGSDSAAIDVGDAATCAAASGFPTFGAGANDQRGQPRDDLQCDAGAYELKFADSPTVLLPPSFVTMRTYGPTRSGFQLNSNAPNSSISITKNLWPTGGQPTAAIGVWWDIVPTGLATTGLNVELCFSTTELRGLTQSNLGFWQFASGTWSQVVVASPVQFSGASPNLCAAISGVPGIGASQWTLATGNPNSGGATPVLSPVFHDPNQNAITSAFVGTGVHGNITAAGSAGTPTGNVVFTKYSGVSCTGTATTETKSLTAGSADASTTTLTSAGLSYTVSYSGDIIYAPATSACRPLNAYAIGTAVLDTNSAAITSALAGASVRDSVTITGTAGIAVPTGSVTFSAFGGTLCTGAAVTQTVPLVSGATSATATSGMTVVPNNGLSFSVNYSGDANYAAASSACQPLNAYAVSTTILDANSAVITSALAGASVRDSVTITGTTGITVPTGSVTFSTFGGTLCTGAAVTQTLPLVSGSASATATSGATVVPSTGLSFLVSYGGDANYAPASSTCQPLNAFAITTTVLDVSNNVLTTAFVGASVHDSVIITGTPGIAVPTGSVTFAAYGGTLCTGAAVTQTVPLVSGATSATASSGATVVPNTGLSFLVSYAGDVNYAPATALCEPLPSVKVTPTVNTAILDTGNTVVTAAPIGSSVRDSAIVTGTAGVPTGSVTFTLYSLIGCTGASTTQNVSLDAAGAAQSSPVTVPNTSLSYLVSYSGDANYTTAVGPCEPLTAVRVAPTISTLIHDANHNVITATSFGTIVHDTATVTGTLGLPTGSATFTLYSGITCQGAVIGSSSANLSNGTVESGATVVPYAGLSFLASYSGDANYAPATAACEPLPASLVAPVLSTSIHDASHSVVSSMLIGSNVHAAVNIWGSVGVPTQSVTFTVYSTLNCTGAGVGQSVNLVSGIAESGTAPVPNTGMSFQVYYVGDTNYASAVGTCQPLNAYGIGTAVLDPNSNVIASALIGTSVRDSVTITGTPGIAVPTGSVIFSAFGGTLCTGAAVTQTVPLVSGATSATATSGTTIVPNTGLSYSVNYSGDANYAPTSAVCQALSPIKVTPTANTVILDANSNVITSAPVGSTVKDSVIITGTPGIAVPTGSVTFSAFGGTLCTGAAVTQTVPLVSGATSATATSGTTTLPNTGLSYLVSYGGDANYAPTTAACEPLTPVKLTSTVNAVVLDANSAVITSALAGASVHDSATVTGTAGIPTGSVTFSAFGGTLCTGAAVTQTVPLVSGATSATATSGAMVMPNTGLSFLVSYGGDASYAPASSACQPLNSYAVSTTILDANSNPITSALVGSTVKDSVTITGTPGIAVPTGSVTFSAFGGTLCTGAAVSQTLPLVSGATSATATSGTTVVPNTGLSFLVSYSGDANYAPATALCEPLPSVKVTPTVNTAILDTGNTVVTAALIGSSVRDSAIVTGTAGIPTGSVTFTLYSLIGCTGASTTQNVALDPTAAALSSPVTVPNTSLSYLVSYSGDANYTTAVGPCEPLTAVRVAPTISTLIHDANHNVITATSFGTIVHDTATVTGTLGLPTGSATFTLYSGITCQGAVTWAQSANLSNGTVESGATVVPYAGLSFLASYSGDANYAPATAACEPLPTNLVAPVLSTSIHDASHNAVTSAAIGSNVHAAVNIWGSVGVPTQSVTFTVYSTLNCTGAAVGQSVNLANGIAESGPAPVPNTGMSFQVYYVGDTNYVPTTAACQALAPIKVPTTTTLTSSRNPITVTQWLTLTAQVTSTLGIAPTGTVTFTIDTTDIPRTLSNGTTTYTTNALLGGTHVITVTYGGDISHIGSSRSGSQVVNNDVPVISSISPTGVVPGSGAFTLTVNGANFVNGSVVRWGGYALPTTFVSSTQLQVAVGADAVVTERVESCTVFNPGPGGGTSNAVPFKVGKLLYNTFMPAIQK